MRKKRMTWFERFLNKILSPLPSAYGRFKQIAKNTQEKMPFIYDEIQDIVMQNLVPLRDSSSLLETPDIDSFSKIISDRIIHKLPNLDDKQLSNFVSNASALGFLDLITRGVQNSINEVEYTVISKKHLFKRILIANRGEIALRIIRACRELGIETVVIYSEADKDSLAVKFADKAYCIGPAPSSQSYLDTQKIVKIAKKSNSDAIHPGYGFLAENADFAALCHNNKIRFIGPSVNTINMMGDKVQARKAMIKQNVPVIPGTEEGLHDFEQGKGLAKNFGYPIIIKAAAGGGGKGMRVVYKEEELKQAFESAQMEAKASFGNPTVYMEKYLEEPKHIEFQILSDSYGNVIHLGERDCSIQRRHQKLLEEAPSPALNSELRDEMGKIAVNAARAASYEGAGTVEFLLDKNNQYYFMEMNTRIQVEHGITEMITGVDLVKEQIKIAAGAKLAYAQEDIKIHGWAIECRINAEDALDDFSPSTGTIVNYITPGGPGIRICSSCHSGHIISPHYDSMISKLMCWGKNRNEAIARMKRALKEYTIEGVDTTIPFHLEILNNKDFTKGNITTNFIEQNNILNILRKKLRKKKVVLTKEEKAIIVSTAVSKYFEKRKIVVNKQNSWATAGRRAMINNGRF